MRSKFATAGIEPSLAELLADPIIHAVMRRDQVSSAELAEIIDAAHARLNRVQVRHPVPVYRFMARSAAG